MNEKQVKTVDDATVDATLLIHNSATKTSIAATKQQQKNNFFFNGLHSNL